ncbi:helix-turn-helix domain-containing protein [Oerskovia flava]|uniref:helix-turn-helix domain-containing protein n=1 Tax=Oerskovia flava TaxID=2986422 RepID=UPI00223E9D75|nr:helix-turn-helix transcriptional regulator [Oerskovia sp. JB1-3-2]
MAVRLEITSPELLRFALQQGRLVRGVSQRQFADELGIGQKWVWEMEAGKPGLLMERLFAMLEAAGVNLFAEINDGGPVDAGDLPSSGEENAHG